MPRSAEAVSSVAVWWAP